MPATGEPTIETRNYGPARGAAVSDHITAAAVPFLIGRTLAEQAGQARS